METTFIISLCLLVVFGNISAFAYGYYLGSKEKKPLTPKGILLLIIHLIINRKNGTTKSKVRRTTPQKNTSKSAKRSKGKIHV